MQNIIATRRSVRKFKPDFVAKKDVIEILKAAMQAPSAYNQQAWHFIILSDRILEEFLKINKNTPKSAPLAILVCQDLNNEKAKGYSVQDCSAATQNILLAAHAKGLGAVWTTVFPDKTASIKSLLDLPDGIQPFACIPIGYSAEGEKSVQSRYDQNKVHYHKWGQKW